MAIQVRLATTVSVSDLSSTIPEWHEIKAGTVGIAPLGLHLLSVYLAGEVGANPGYEFCERWVGSGELRVKTENKEGCQVFTGHVSEIDSYSVMNDKRRFRMLLTCNTAQLVA